MVANFWQIVVAQSSPSPSPIFAIILHLTAAYPIILFLLGCIYCYR